MKPDETSSGSHRKLQPPALTIGHELNRLPFHIKSIILLEGESSHGGAPPLPGWYPLSEREERLFTNRSNRPGDDMDEIRTDGDPIAWRMWSTWEDRVKVDDFNCVFRAGKRGRRTQQVGRVSDICLGSKLCGLQTVSALRPTAMNPQVIQIQSDLPIFWFSES